MNRLKRELGFLTYNTASCLPLEELALRRGKFCCRTLQPFSTGKGETRSHWGLEAPVTTSTCWLNQCDVSGAVFSAFMDQLVDGYGLVADHSAHAVQREAHSAAPERVVEPEGPPKYGSLCLIF
jgi:hypothetical protein